MAILRCNKCQQLLEQPDELSGKTIPCPRCQSAVQIYPTLFFVTKLLERYFQAQKDLLALKKSSIETPEPAPTVSGADFDLSNTSHFATEAQHGPIHDWFQKRQIKTFANMRSVDTSGFFDEIAEAIGGNLPLFSEVLQRICGAQRKELSSATIYLDKKSPEDASEISRFCQQLYDFAFVAKCFHNRTENNIRLILQTAPGIRNFFAGEWLEWNALMTCLRYAKERGKRFSCARGLEITLQNGASYELDVFILIDGQIPILVECKTNEFREKLERYQTLKKRLHLEQKQFIMCIAGLEEEKAKGYSAMYDMTFVNEKSLQQHLTQTF